MASTLVDDEAAASAPSRADGEVTGPAHDEIARLAYSYWEARGREGGSPCEDWFRAEQELQKVWES